MSSQRVLTLLLLVLVSIGLLLNLSAMEPVIEAIRNIDPTLLIIALGIQVITAILLALQWQEILKWASYKTKWLDMLLMNMKGSFMDAITPGAKVGGEVVRIYLLKPYVHSYSQATAVVGLQKFVSIFVFILLTGISLIALPQASKEFVPVFFGFSVVLALIVIFLVAILTDSKIGRFFFRFIPKKLRNKSQKIFLQIRSVFSVVWNRKNQTPRHLLLAIIIWVLYPIKLMILAKGTGINPLPLTAITFISYMVSMVPLLPGSIGTFEGTMTGLLVLYGISWQQGLSLAIVFRFVTFWFPLIITGLFVAGDYVFQRGISMPKEWIPSLITISNLVLGTLAILLATTGYLTIASILVLIAAFTDKLDGFVARRLNVVTDLGKQLDSLSDLVSFGVAPVVIGWQTELVGVLGALVAVIYIASSAFRLARFNASPNNDNFVGLPITIAGAILAGYYLWLSPSYNWTAWLMLVLSICMVSSYKLPRRFLVFNTRNFL
ncbi:MAG: CDP-diacylglycerol--serine O-phosphatidyltransferase [Firmicutes bacterium]|nr:CDP-diacylglycerol--serine O-phosphatidyltransferase [Bacillota bacterium]